MDFPPKIRIKAGIFGIQDQRRLECTNGSVTSRWARAQLTAAIGRAHPWPRCRQSKPKRRASYRSVRCTSCSTELRAFVILSHIYILFEFYPLLTHKENLQVPALYTQWYFRANTICSLKSHLEMVLEKKKQNKNKSTYLSVLEQNNKVFWILLKLQVKHQLHQHQNVNYPSIIITKSSYVCSLLFSKIHCLATTVFKHTTRMSSKVKCLT